MPKQRQFTDEQIAASEAEVVTARRIPVLVTAIPNGVHVRVFRHETEQYARDCLRRAERTSDIAMLVYAPDSILDSPATIAEFGWSILQEREDA